MTNAQCFGMAMVLLLQVASGRVAVAQEATVVIFAVVTKISDDRRQVTAQVSTGDTAEETVLVVSDEVLRNPIWRTLEVCHALRGEATKQPEGYHLLSVRVLSAGMLPMTLQGVAGDCLLKKALEYAPLIE